MGNESIDIGLENIWRSWFEFRKGKRQTFEFHRFQYALEKNLFRLFHDLNSGLYRHSGYKKFVVNDNKRREISVATIRDRVVHRLIYDHLNELYDETFIHDVWSWKLTLNPKSDKIFKAKHGLKYLGVVLWPSGRRLNKRNKLRVAARLNTRNVGSYHGLINQHCSIKLKKHFSWIMSGTIDRE